MSNGTGKETKPGNAAAKSDQGQKLAAAIYSTTMDFSTFYKTDPRDFSKVIDNLEKQASKLAAAAHRQLVEKEAEIIKSEIDELSKLLDATLADKQAYNEFLRQRAEFWSTAAKLARESRERAINQSEANVSVGTEKSSHNSVALSESQLNGDVSSASASTVDSVNSKPEKEILKKPLPLAERDLTAATLAFLQRDSPLNKARKMPVPPPRLDERQLQSTNVLNINGAVKKPQNVGVQNGKPQAAAAGHPIQRVELVKIIADPVGRTSGESSGGSMSGSFLDGNAGNDYDPHFGQIVKNLGFSNLDDSAATSSSSVLAARENEPLADSNQATTYGELRRPPKLKLTTTTLYSPEK